MSYTLTVVPKDSFLHAVVTGENTRENVMGYLEEIRQLCRHRDHYRVLVEERLDGPRLPRDEVFQIVAEEVRRSGATFEALAYVDVNAEDETMRLTAKVAVARGALAGVFNTVIEAERWLMAHPSGPGGGTLP